jgi:hypothetical protein
MGYIGDHFRPNLPLDQGLDRPVGQPQQLHHRCQGAAVVQIFRLGLVNGGRFWVTRRISVFFSMASSRARIDRFRPTTSGATIWGKMTISRSGIRG